MTPACQESPALQRLHHLGARAGVPKKSASLNANVARAGRVDLAHHLVYRAVAEAQAIHQLLGAEGAGVVAAARGLDEGAVDVALRLDQVVARRSACRIECSRSAL